MLSTFKRIYIKCYCNIVGQVFELVVRHKHIRKTNILKITAFILPIYNFFQMFQCFIESHVYFLCIRGPKFRRCRPTSVEEALCERAEDVRVHGVRLGFSSEVAHWNSYDENSDSASEWAVSEGYPEEGL